jgi:hypothetical protein
LTFDWSVIKEGLNWEKIPKSVKEFNDESLIKRRDKFNRVLFFLFGGGVLDIMAQ